ncbi:RNA-directed DNA polymerase, eukaryota, Reverse transcriptase zinc-binding domain protein [Artemisia annua]|uniref:RNA-directed DNA polymerase, eukaryota, Reverse transcriptase zinc-binding domain protein n=1 Tax=Artemisia annua TaxID=35608 RepID=A0A2U1P3H9_ARTAN|nr:RNA-directed DNA polymerase, eukaryota, Reverse transcriptase zinc-binding domain protein [Artemisia annua]
MESKVVDNRDKMNEQLKTPERNINKENEGSPKKAWTVKDVVLEAMRRSANKFFELKNKEEVDERLNKKLQPPLFVTNRWSQSILNYFKNGWENMLLRWGLWDELVVHKVLTNGYHWIMTGDLNVTLHPKEHTMGGANMTIDMMEFSECVDKIEVTELSSSRLFFTWDKNPLNTILKVMKKLDRIIVNEEFLTKFNNAIH